MSDLNITVNLITNAAAAQLKKLETATKKTEDALGGLGKKSKKTTGLMAKNFSKLKTIVAGVFGGQLLFALFRKFTQAVTEVIGFTLRFEDALVGVGKVLDLTGSSLTKFGAEIKELSTTIPIAADKLLDIAQVAARLGVRGSDNIIKFTDTIARLAAVSDLDGSRAALVLARLLNITGESTGTVDKLGSAIVRLGNNFAASESEIADVALDIARGTARFNIASKDILGISVALKETGAQSEISGSQIGFLFGEITKALNSGGPKLAEFARITGKTTEELGDLINTNPTEILLSLTDGLRSLSGSAQETEQALSDLGLNNLRIKKVLPSLVKNYDNFRSALKQTNEEYKNNNELNKVSGRAFDTLSSKSKILGNTVLNIGDNLLKSLVPALKVTVDGLVVILKPLTEVAKVVTIIGEGLGEIAAKGVMAFGQSAIQKNIKKWKEESDGLAKTIKDLNEQIEQNTDFMIKNEKIGLDSFNVKRAADQLDLVLKLNKAQSDRNVLLEKQGLLDREGNELGTNAANELAEADKAASKKSALRTLEAKDIKTNADLVAEIKEEAAARSAADEESVRLETEARFRDHRAASFLEDEEEANAREEVSLTRLKDKFFNEGLAENESEIEKEKDRDKRKKLIEKIKIKADIKATKARDALADKEKESAAALQDDLTVLAKSGSKEAGNLLKAQNIKKILVKTPEAVSNAYTYGLGIGGPVVGVAFGAAAAAAQGQRVSDVASINFQDGGVVPGSSFTGDNVAANVNSGEVILNRQQQANTLFAISNGSNNGGSGEGQKEIVVNSTIELDGEVVGQAVSRQVANGLVLGENE